MGMDISYLLLPATPIALLFLAGIVAHSMSRLGTLIKTIMRIDIGGDTTQQTKRYWYGILLFF